MSVQTEYFREPDVNQYKKEKGFRRKLRLQTAALAFHLKQSDSDARSYTRFVPLARTDKNQILCIDKHSGRFVYDGIEYAEASSLSLTNMWVLFEIIANLSEPISIKEIAHRVSMIRDDYNNVDVSVEPNSIMKARIWLKKLADCEDIIINSWGIGYSYDFDNSGLKTDEREMAKAGARSALGVLGNDDDVLLHSMIYINSQRPRIISVDDDTANKSIFERMRRVTLVEGLYDLDFDGICIVGKGKNFPLTPSDNESLLTLYGAGGEVLTPDSWRKVAGVDVANGLSLRWSRQRFKELQNVLGGMDPMLGNLIEEVKFGYRFKASEFGPVGGT